MHSEVNDPLEFWPSDTETPWLGALGMLNTSIAASTIWRHVLSPLVHRCVCCPGVYVGHEERVNSFNGTVYKLLLQDSAMMVSEATREFGAQHNLEL